MLVTQWGRVFGTIGGGRMELYCQERAQELLAKGARGWSGWSSSPRGRGDLGMICGGEVTVWFQYLPGGRLPQEPGRGARYLLLEQGEGGDRALLCHREGVPRGSASGGERPWSAAPGAAATSSGWSRPGRCSFSGRGTWPRPWPRALFP